MEDVQTRHEAPVVVDAGSGNAYLGFILYELFLKDAEAGTLLSVEGRPELTQRAQERAGRLGFGRMQFQTAHLDEAQWPERVHVLMALHACDTATDDALAVAIQKGADHVAVVPCCQAEVAQQLKESKQAVEPTLALLVDRIATYYPRYLSSLALYVGVAALLFVGLRAWSAQRDEARA